MLIDVAIPADRNVIKKGAEKILKGKILIIEIQRMWNVKANVIPVIIEAIGIILTLRLLMSYIYIYGPTFGNAETVSFYLLHNVSTLNQCREVSCVTFVCKHFAS